MRIVVTLAVLALVAAPVLARAQPQPQPDPTQQALGQMLAEAQGREASALVQAYTLRVKLAEVTAQRDAETKRADEAEAKLKAAEKATDQPADVKALGTSSAPAKAAE
ncbi:hypothetical protein [Methylobacterium sp. J-092]|uniref:hypothetical protein n=1 Tax=Methylobacterium sp. J-092 TaxID=2836667 RepID=UPI001FBA0DFE|nr:hypothetical protein [Methylobacterium sp. J-092]MCJ2009213.1 hypothetical protein [Methylobacterium sp. J-092]